MVYVMNSVAGERSGAAALPVAPTPGATTTVTPSNDGGIPPNANIVNGYDIEALVDAAMGQRPMPTAPMYLDSFGMPLTRLAPAGMVPAAATPMQHQQPAAAAPAPSALDIANAALAAVGAAYGSGGNAGGHGAGGGPTRVLVLSNMVMQEDLATDEDYKGLSEEVREECAKFGQLLGMQIPRRIEGNIQPSAILKIFWNMPTFRMLKLQRES